MKLVDQHLYSAASSLGGLWQRRGATLLTVLVMALALALPLLLHLALRNLERFSGTLEEAREISVFVATDAQASAIDALIERTRANGAVESVTRRTPEDALAELSALPGFADAVDVLGTNPLPTVLLVAPKATAQPNDIRALATALDDEPIVDLVQYDLEWRERLSRALALAERVVTVVALLLGLGALLVVGNTIRLDVESRAAEIAIVQQLGGSNGFVRRPFLYAGCWYGLMASVLALVGVVIASEAIAGPVAALAASYGTTHALRGLDATATITALVAGIMLGWLGAFAASSRHLARGAPR